MSYLLCMEPAEGSLPYLQKLRNTLTEKNLLLPVWYPWLPLGFSQEPCRRERVEHLKELYTESLHLSKLVTLHDWIYLSGDTLPVINPVMNSPIIWHCGGGFLLGYRGKSSLTGKSLPAGAAPLTFRSWKWSCMRLFSANNNDYRDGGEWERIWSFNFRTPEK